MAKNGLWTGRQLSGYVVQRRLGSGARSTIFEVLDPRSGQSYALKRIVRQTASDERFFRQSENEFHTSQHIDHPVIRKIHKVVRIRRLFRLREMHLLMEMVYGTTVESHRPTEPLEVVRIFRQVAEGLDAMHAAGFAHADLKPNNIVVDPAGPVKLIDLGQSCPLGTIKNRIQGTPDYIAPEQVFRRPIDQRTDIFNLGATLYWVLTHQHMPTVLPKALPGRDIALIAAGPVRPPHEVKPDVPPALSRMVMECVNANPADRPANMKAIHTRLEIIETVLRKNHAQAGTAYRLSDDSELFDPAELADSALPDADTVDWTDFQSE